MITLCCWASSAGDDMLPALVDRCWTENGDDDDDADE